jgi:hypothetical protein
MKDVANVTGRMGEGETMAPAEEAVNVAALADEAPGSGATEETNIDAGGPGPGAAATETGEANSEPWSALLQFGAELVSALTTSEDRVVAAHPWVERDPATGARSLKVPLPPPETIRRIADALSTISNALLSAGGKEETR